jgi:hypothetical protein
MIRLERAGVSLLGAATMAALKTGPASGLGRPRMESTLDPRQKDAAIIRLGLVHVNSKLNKLGAAILRDAGQYDGQRREVHLPLDRVRQAVRDAMPEIVLYCQHMNVHRARRPGREALDRARHEAVYSSPYFYPFKYSGNKRLTPDYPEKFAPQSDIRTVGDSAKKHRKNRRSYLQRKIYDAVVEWHTNQVPPNIRELVLQSLATDYHEFRKLICPNHQRDEVRQAIVGEAQSAHAVIKSRVG